MKKINEIINKQLQFRMIVAAAKVLKEDYAKFNALTDEQKNAHSGTNSAGSVTLAVAEVIRAANISHEDAINYIINKESRKASQTVLELMEIGATTHQMDAIWTSIGQSATEHLDELVIV
jgi:hypothetical protein